MLSRRLRWIRGLMWMGLLIWVMVVWGCGGTAGQSGLKINELLAKGSAKTHVDWLEIYNPADHEVSLAGLQLKDSNSGGAWDFPKDAKIGAKGYLQIICDGTGINGHTNFKLSSKGETILLQTKDGQIIDKVSYPAQKDDVSWGRSPDGGDTWKPFATPTPGKANL